MIVSPLRLRPLRLEDEPAVRAAQQQLAADGFEFAIGLQPDTPWAEYVDRMERYRREVDLPAGFVPATFLVAVVDDEIVGRTSIRHELNDFLHRVGGHIGYGVLPGARRRGHATEILRQSLVIARSYGIGRALVTCDDDNIGSATVIERCGGVLEDVVEQADGPPKRRYWIA